MWAFGGLDPAPILLRQPDRRPNRRDADVELTVVNMDHQIITCVRVRR